MSVDSLTISDAVQQAPAERAKPRAARPVRPEPPGPRSVGLALARLGLVGGTDARPAVLGLGPDSGRELRAALRQLIAEGALARDSMLGIYRPTALGLDLLGPDLRQRPFLSTR